MAFFVYLIGSTKKLKLTSYVGYTNNIQKRLNLHNRGKGAKFTRGRKWKLIYSEKFKTKNEAIKRECYIKKNRKLRNILKNKNK
jgi:putative endonuclease